MKAAVFPVPFFARANMSRPCRATGMLSSWIGEGLSKPASNMPIIKSRESLKSSNSKPLVLVTSWRVEDGLLAAGSVQGRRARTGHDDGCRMTHLCLMSVVPCWEAQLLLPVI